MSDTFGFKQDKLPLKVFAGSLLPSPHWPHMHAQLNWAWMCMWSPLEIEVGRKSYQKFMAILTSSRTEQSRFPQKTNFTHPFFLAAKVVLVFPTRCLIQNKKL